MKYDEAQWKKVKESIRLDCRKGSYNLHVQTVRERVMPALGLATYPNGRTFFDLAYGAWGNNANYMDCLDMLEELVEALPEPIPPTPPAETRPPLVFLVPNSEGRVTVELSFPPMSRYLLPRVTITGVSFDTGQVFNADKPDALSFGMDEARIVQAAIAIAQAAYNQGATDEI